MKKCNKCSTVHNWKGRFPIGVRCSRSHLYSTHLPHKSVSLCVSIVQISYTVVLTFMTMYTLMRNMAFTNVEQMTMIAKDKDLWVKGSWKTIFSDEPLFFFLQQTFCVQNEYLDFFFIQTFHVKTKGNSGSLLQKANVFAFMVSKSEGKEQKRQTLLCWGKMSSFFSRKNTWNQSNAVYLFIFSQIYNQTFFYIYIKLVTDWFVCSFRKGWGRVGVLSPRYPGVGRGPQTLPRWSVAVRRRVRHTNTLVRLSKWSSHNIHKRLKSVQRGRGCHRRMFSRIASSFSPRGYENRALLKSHFRSQKQKINNKRNYGKCVKIMRQHKK